MKLSETLCLDHFYILVTSEQFKELSTLKKTIDGFTHKIVKIKDNSWEGNYWATSSGEYIEFMQPKATNAGLGMAFSSKSPIYADVRELKNEFKKLDWIEGTHIWEDGTPWFTWSSIKTKKKDLKLDGKFVTWSMFYHPRYHQYKTREPFGPCSVARIRQLDIFMKPELESFVKHHLKWTNSIITTTKKGLKIEIPNREFETFTININYKKMDEDFLFHKIFLETHQSKKLNLPKLKTINFSLKKGVLIIENKFAR